MLCTTAVDYGAQITMNTVITKKHVLTKRGGEGIFVPNGQTSKLMITTTSQIDFW